MRLVDAAVVRASVGSRRVRGHVDMPKPNGIDEAELLLATRFLDVVSGAQRAPATAHARDRRRAIDAALWLDENAAQPIDLDAAAQQVGSARSTSCAPSRASSA